MKHGPLSSGSSSSGTGRGRRRFVPSLENEVDAQLHGARWGVCFSLVGWAIGCSVKAWLLYEADGKGGHYTVLVVFLVQALLAAGLAAFLWWDSAPARLRARARSLGLKGGI